MTHSAKPSWLLLAEVQMRKELGTESENNGGPSVICQELPSRGDYMRLRHYLCEARMRRLIAIQDVHRSLPITSELQSLIETIKDLLRLVATDHHNGRSVMDYPWEVASHILLVARALLGFYEPALEFQKSSTPNPRDEDSIMETSHLNSLIGEFKYEVQRG